MNLPMISTPTGDSEPKSFADVMSAFPFNPLLNHPHNLSVHHRVF